MTWLARFAMAGISDEMYERLRQILEKQNKRTYTFEEAKEIGDGFIDFFNTLIEWAQEEINSDS